MPNAATSVTSSLVIAAFVLSTAAMGGVPQMERDSINRIIGATGVYAADEDVYKIVFPREAATIVWNYQTLSIVQEVFGFVKRKLSGAKRRMGASSGERGAGKGGWPCPASADRRPEREQRSGTKMNFRMADNTG